MIICVEGPDGFGKSTLCASLSKSLNAELIKFPNEDFESGKRLRQIINKEYSFEPMSFQALQIINRLETFETLDPTKDYIFDRGKLSGIVYALTDGLPENWVRKVSDYITDADITVIITGRSYREDNDIYSDSEYQKRIRQLYMGEGKRVCGRVVWVCNYNSPEKMLEMVLMELGRAMFVKVMMGRL